MKMNTFLSSLLLSRYRLNSRLLNRLGGSWPDKSILFYLSANSIALMSHDGSLNSAEPI